MASKAAACFLLLLTLVVCGRADNLDVVLKAKWSATPLLLEAAEFLAAEDPALLWRLLGAWQDRVPQPREGCWDEILRAATAQLLPSLAKVLQLALTTRQYSAHLEMLRSLSEVYSLPEGTCCFADVGGAAAFSPADVASALKQASTPGPQLFGFDHIYNPSGNGKGEANGSGAVHAVLYGAIGSSCLQQFHAVLAEAAEQPGQQPLSYAYRPVLLSTCTRADACAYLGTGGALQLPAYGVEMVIKNMEYSALDDAKEEQAANELPPAGAAAAAALEASRQSPDGTVSHEALDGVRPSAPAAVQQQLQQLDVDEDDMLKVTTVKTLGLKAAQYIAAAEDPLTALVEVSGNLPSKAAALSRLRLEVAVKVETTALHRTFSPGSSYLLLNGMAVDISTFDLYALIDQIRSEVRLAEQLAQSGLQVQVLKALLALRSMPAADVGEVRLDITSEDHVHWLNDLEEDSMYRRWSRSLLDLLRPMFPGQLPRIGRNVYNAAFLVDPATAAAGKAAAQALEMQQGQWPVRLGIVLLPAGASAASGVSQPGTWQELTLSEKAAAAFLTLQALDSTRAGLQFLAYAEGLREAELQLQLAEEAAPAQFFTEGQIEGGFRGVWLELQEDQRGDLTTDATLQQVVMRQEGILDQVIAAEGFAVGKGIGGTGDSSGQLWFNGLLSSGSSNWRSSLFMALQGEMQNLQELIYTNKLADEEEDLLEAILQLGKALPRYNAYLLAPPAPAASAAKQQQAPTRQLALTGEQLHPRSLLAAGTLPLTYLHTPGSEDDLKGISHWVIADLDSQEGQAIGTEAMKYLEQPGSAAARIAFLHNPSEPEAEPSSTVVAVSAALQLPSRRAKLSGYLRALFAAAAGGQVSLQEAVTLAEQQGLNAVALEAALAPEAAEPLQMHVQAQAAACREALELAPGEAAVVTNGRVILASRLAAGLEAGDFALLDLYAANFQHASQVREVLDAAIEDGSALQSRLSGSTDDDDDSEVMSQLSDAALVASSVLATHGPASEEAMRSSRVAQVLALRVVGSLGFDLTAGGRTGMQLTALLDPLSRTAQKLAPVLAWLHTELALDLRVYLNPVADLAKPPGSYYRYVLPPPGFTGQLQDLPAANFSGLPARKVLTLNMDVPEAWLVEPTQAAADLDNVRLADVGGKIAAEYELEAVMLTGSCVATTSGRSERTTPRGVQLHMGRGSSTHMLDTLVMANLGYFQLKAAPAVWTLTLAPGRSQQLYAIHSSMDLDAFDRLGSEASAVDSQVPVVLSSLSGRNMVLSLRKRPGMEAEDVLDTGKSEESSVWRSISALWSGGSSSSSSGGGGGGHKQLPARQPGMSPEDDPHTIHIFTVASGHMYERLQKIMVLSVLRQTRNRVKFWFIKNYMSPQMKRFLPHMAQQYAFDYEFVTYKWPHWLHKQTEKQRVIWAYKILFLDVLFPLNLRKVIFVDSDQVIRADFAQLWYKHLEGKPLAYTPFCDNNRDMDGFRFWNQGFWREHLAGLPYHISALYVVDLARFRQTAAGDQLRVVYEQLSRDPNSLANLDQDLPNYAQHVVPIFSLPQEWLWCETWCGNETKAAAKTIDLCNNPLTKEPKLDGARRIVKEWPALDAEQRAFTQQVERQWVAQSREAAGQPHAAGLVGMTDVQAELIQGSSKPVSSNTGLHDTRQQQQQQQAQEGATGAGEDAGGDGESCGWDGGTEGRGQQCSWDGTSQREAEVEDLAEHSEL